MFKSILFAVALTSGVGMPCAFADEVQPIEEKVEFKQENKKLVSFDDEEKTITFTADELNNYTWQNLYNYWFDDDNYDGNFSIVYNSMSYTYDRIETGALIFTSLNNDIVFLFNSSEYNPDYETDYNDYIFIFDYRHTFEYSLDITTSQGFYSDFKSAIELDIQANSQVDQPFMQPVLQELVSLLVSGITAFAGGIGTGVSTLVSDIFINNGQLSVFGSIIAIFGGIALAIGLSRWVMNYLTSLGAKN